MSSHVGSEMIRLLLESRFFNRTICSSRSCYIFVSIVLGSFKQAGLTLLGHVIMYIFSYLF